MTKEDIEKAAIHHANMIGWDHDPEEIRKLFAYSFKSGTKWRINSVWHKDIQKGKIKKPILVKFNNGLFDLFEDVRELKGLSDMVSIFAYIEDLLPNKED